MSTTSTSIEFFWNGETTQFKFGSGDADELMDFSVAWFQDDRPNEIKTLTVEITLDEAEYLAKRLTEAIAFQRKQNKQRQQEEQSVSYQLAPQEAVDLLNTFPNKKEIAERDEIKSALLRFAGDKKKAADWLGISPRTMYRRVKQYDLEHYIIDK